MEEKILNFINGKSSFAKAPYSLVNPEDAEIKIRLPFSGRRLEELIGKTCLNVIKSINVTKRKNKEYTIDRKEPTNAGVCL